MVNKKATAFFLIAIVLLAGSLTFVTLQKESAINKICSTNETQDNILENLLVNAEKASIKQLNKETREGKKSSYTITQMQEFYAPTYRELEENNTC